MRRLAIVAALALPLTLAGCGPSGARKACINAVVREYEAADKVLQQPADLNAFCASWNDNPPGISPP